jgi:gluconokinase
MGVTGSGKSTLGRLIAKRLSYVFLDADDFHPRENIEKIRKGIPLSDADRIPWLEKIHEEVKSLNKKGMNVVLACSALKALYRSILFKEISGKVIYLKGDKNLIRDRILGRKGHFAKETILDSQFATLEEPLNAICLDIRKSKEELVEELIKYL